MTDWTILYLGATEYRLRPAPSYAPSRSFHPRFTPTSLYPHTVR